jgi:hypothetical protein
MPLTHRERMREMLVAVKEEKRNLRHKCKLAGIRLKIKVQIMLTSFTPGAPSFEKDGII